MLHERYARKIFSKLITCHLHLFIYFLFTDIAKILIFCWLKWGIVKDRTLNISRELAFVRNIANPWIISLRNGKRSFVHFLRILKTYLVFDIFKVILRRFFRDLLFVMNFPQSILIYDLWRLQVIEITHRLLNHIRGY